MVDPVPHHQVGVKDQPNNSKNPDYEYAICANQIISNYM
jgi:hypothetical protein